MNWTEEFRPTKIEQIIGQHGFVEDAKIGIGVIKCLTYFYTVCREQLKQLRPSTWAENF